MFKTVDEGFFTAAENMLLMVLNLFPGAQEQRDGRGVLRDAHGAQQPAIPSFRPTVHSQRQPEGQGQQPTHTHTHI